MLFSGIFKLFLKVGKTFHVVKSITNKLIFYILDVLQR